MTEEWVKKEEAFCAMAGCQEAPEEDVKLGTRYQQEGWHDWHGRKVQADMPVRCPKCGTEYTIQDGRLVTTADGTPARSLEPAADVGP